MKNFDMRALGGVQRFVIGAPSNITDMVMMIRWINGLPGQVFPLGPRGQQWAVVGLLGYSWEGGAGDPLCQCQATAFVEAVPAQDLGEFLRKVAGVAPPLPDTATQ